MTPSLPTSPRTITFIDGQNLFYAAKEAFGYSYPNYDPLCLSQTICQSQGWNLIGTRFYTGVPDVQDDPFWHHFWSAKLAQMGRLGVTIFSRPLRYRNQTVNLPDGTKHTILVGQEKGIDVRVALDIVRLANEDLYDCAFPTSPTFRNNRGRDKTDWIRTSLLAVRSLRSYIQLLPPLSQEPILRDLRQAGRQRRLAGRTLPCPSTRRT